MPTESGNKPVIHTKKHVARLERERRQSRIILYTFFGILAAVILLLAYGFLDVNYFQLQKPVAKVGDVEISAAKFESRVRLQRQQLLASYNVNMQYQQIFGMDTTSQLQQIEYYLNTPLLLGQTVLDQLVNEEVIRQEAAKRGITVSEEEIETAIRDQLGFFPDGTYTPTVTPTTFFTPAPPAAAFSVVTKTPLPSVTVAVTLEATLTPTATFTPTATSVPTLTPTLGPTPTAFPTATPYTLEGYQSEYQASLKNFTRYGMDEAEYRSLVEMNLLQEKLKAEVTTDVTSTEEQVWARHILVADVQTAAVLINKIQAGEDFGELAKEFSSDTGSAVNGGDLGWFGKGAMVPEFETAAFALEKPGDITQEPVSSQFGFHIIQLIAKQERPIAASQVEQAKDTAFADWVKALREEYAIETFDDFWKAHVPSDPNFETLATDIANTAAAVTPEE
jgi:parvulin-like peptidyl-prolyl isomerase